MDIKIWKKLIECHCISLEEHWNDKYSSLMIIKTINIIVRFRWTKICISIEILSAKRALNKSDSLTFFFFFQEKKIKEPKKTVELIFSPSTNSKNLAK